MRKIRRKRAPTYHKKRVPKYYKIYEKILKDPYIANYKIAKKTGVTRSTVARYLRDMYRFSILIGPSIFVKPAQNYHQYAYFLQFEDPSFISIHPEKFPSTLFRSMEFGPWNSLIISEKMMDFSSLKGFKQNFFQGIKGMTHFSAVTSLDWDTSLETMYSTAVSPVKKSTLYHEIPNLFWNEENWVLYHVLRKNIRVNMQPILKKYQIRYIHYREWWDNLSHGGAIQTAFYPHRLDRSFAVDFLFESEYHQQLKDILGMLPSTGIFFSVGTRMLARLFYSSKKEKEELLTFILWLGKKGYYTNVYNAAVISSSHEDKGLIMI